MRKRAGVGVIQRFIYLRYEMRACARYYARNGALLVTAVFIPAG